jgi:succinate dehydrogenase / fumarate reductase cytochrome b subunit
MPKATIQRKWFALSGVVPLGAFVAVHIVTTATGLGGQARFGRTFAHHAWTTALLLLLVLLPLAFHAGYGVYAAVTRRAGASLPSWQPKLRRAAALGTLAFVVAHMIELPARVWTGSLGTGALFDVVSAHLSSTWHGVPLVAVLYLAGVAATLAHFALELWVFFPAMGIVLAEGARKALGWGLVAGGSLLFLLAGDTIVFFATGQRLLGPKPPVLVPEGPPPAACSPN